MFYQITDAVRETPFAQLAPDALTAGYVETETLQQIYSQFGFAPSTVAACAAASGNFRSGVEVYDGYTFTELRIISFDHGPEEDDCVALYIRKNLLLVVNVEDRDGSTRARFQQALGRVAPATVTQEKLIYYFLDALVGQDHKRIEDVGNEIAAMEERLLEEEPGEEYNRALLAMKKKLQMMRNYYEQLLDITEALDENENELLPDRELMFITNLNQKIIRLREDTDSLQKSVEHLQDAYSAMLDMRLNRTMKVLTVITTIFFPLTIIVGWYGMNFQSMPEFLWRHGYLYVIVLSVVMVAGMVLIGRKKKWF